MNLETLLSFIYNASLLLILNMATIYLSTRRASLSTIGKVILGLLNGLICVAALINPVFLSPTLPINFSGIIVCMTGMFFGLEPAIVTMSIVVAGHLFIGGATALPGLISAEIYLSIGLLWNKHRLQSLVDRMKAPWLEFAALGAVIAVVQNLSLFLIPHSSAAAVLPLAILPILFVFVVGSVFIFVTAFEKLLTHKRNELYAKELDTQATTRRNLELEVAHRKTIFSTLINSLSDHVFFKDTSGVYRDCNTAFERFVGKDRNQILGTKDRDLFLQDTAKIHCDVASHVMELGVPKTFEEFSIDSNGEEIYLETYTDACYNTDHEVIGLYGISRNITDRKNKENEILYLTYHDVATGLYNSTYIDMMRSRYSLNAPLPFSVIMCDVNGLKLVNDAFGHTEGTRLLKDAAEILKHFTRSTDIIGRVGGDEFCILMPHTSMLEVQNVSELIEEGCHDFNGSRECPFAVNMAMGYATGETHDDSIDTLIRTAENFMNKKKLLDYQSTHNSVISSIKTTMYEKSLETEEHAERLAELSESLGRQLGLRDEELLELKLFAMLHDIGKIGVDKRILTKQEKLTDDDWLEIRKHPEIGYKIAHASADLKGISDFILYHHERWDGRGYPLGLAGQDIPLLSRVLSVVDSYDAMTNDRVYRKALSETEAIAEISKNAGSQFDPAITEIFIQIVMNTHPQMQTVSYFD